MGYPVVVDQALCKRPEANLHMAQLSGAPSLALRYHSHPHIFVITMRPNIFPPALFLLFNLTVNAQSPGIAWEQVHDGAWEVLDSYGIDLTVQGDNDLYVLSHDPDGGGGYALERLDRMNGDSIWLHVLSDTLYNAIGIAACAPNGVVFGAQSIGYGVVMQFDDAGALVWNHAELLGTTYEASDVGSGDLVCDNAGNTYVAFNHKPTTEYWETRIRKLGPDGSLIWAYTYAPEGGLNNLPTDIRLDPAGNLIVAGSYQTGDVVDPHNYPFVLKIDPNGNYLWDQLLVPDQPGFYKAVDLLVDAVGNATLAVIAGPLETGHVVQYDPGGNLNWDTGLDTSSQPEFLFQEEPTTPIYVIAEGWSSNENFLVKLSASGVLVQQATTGTIRCHHAVRVSENLMLLSTNTGDLSLGDAYFTAIDTLGNLLWSLVYPQVEDRFYPEAWNMVVADSARVYATGSHRVNSGEWPTTIAIDIPCLPDPLEFCSDLAYTENVTSHSNAWMDDLNGDGFTDILVTSLGQSSVRVYWNNDGHYEEGPVIDLPYLAAYIRTADINGDGTKDILVTELQGNHVMVIANAGGNFNYLSSVASTTLIWQVEAGHANADGFPDLFVMHDLSGGPVILCYLNDGTGGFSPVPVQVDLPGLPISMAIGDVNLDGLSDVAANGNNSSFASLHINQGDGTFSGPQNLNADVGVTRIKDINDDGWPEVLTVAATSVHVYWNQNGSGFQQETWNMTGAPITGVPHPLPGSTGIRYFLPATGGIVVGLDAWNSCTADYGFFNLATSYVTDLFAVDVTGDAGTDLLSVEQLTGDVQIWRNCDHTPVYVGVDERPAAQRPVLSVFPNPAGDLVTAMLPVDHGELSITDAMGRVVVRQQVTGKRLELPVSHFASGIYTLALSAEGRATAKLVVAH